MVKQAHKLPAPEKEGPLHNSRFNDDECLPAIRPGNLIVLTGPSGVGKGTLTELMLATVPRLVKSVSVTTRECRPGEEEGVDYFFVSREEFEKRKSKLLEWAEFAGNCYGTPQSWVDEQIARGNDVLLEIEVQGADQIRQQRGQSLLIFVSPPPKDGSVEAKLLALEERLVGRGTESPDKIKRRLAKAKEELSQILDFHYEVINDDIDEAVNNLVHIVYAERCRIRK